MSISPIGIEDLKCRIENHSIDIPQARTLQELQGWLNGYAQCQKDILDILDAKYESMNQRG